MLRCEGWDASLSCMKCHGRAAFFCFVRSSACSAKEAAHSAARRTTAAVRTVGRRLELVLAGWLKTLLEDTSSGEWVCVRCGGDGGRAAAC